ncbi:hypothetical protein OE88DRAFT_1044729 [Heliocybe sulcata]|uniref:Uncharacterized protein n=1 Tax=Heliocybe sulcata TaxID=5364 RepID=A0A5C3MXN0_9AGAM|nr:hypothetical protein OE88DRAFT_1044729 [Heliocybe sulcata]
MPVNGIISVWKVTLRHWRDVRNRKHIVYVSGRQERKLPYLPPTGTEFVQRRWSFASKALANQSKHCIPKSDIPAGAVAGLAGRPALLIRTLNKNRLDVKDFVDLTGRINRTVRFPMAPEERWLKIHYLELGHKKGGDCIPFPPESQGFLYWHLEPHAPPISGQVRFRTTTSPDPATFPSGHDLQLPDAGTWNIPLFRIARALKYSGIRALLLSEKLVTADVLGAAVSASSQEKLRLPKSDIPSTATGLRKDSSLPLRTLKQARLIVEDFVDLAGRVSKDVRFPMAPEEPKLHTLYFRRDGKYISFPQDSQGFFYWHVAPDAPPVSGQVRFRTTASSDPATFPSGRDLQLPNGRIWHISLFSIARRSQYSGLRAHILFESIVTAKTLDTARNIAASSQDRRRIPKSDIRAPSATRLIGRPALLLRRLNKNRLDIQDFVNLTGQTLKIVRFPVAPEEPRLLMRYFQSGGRTTPFPPDSHGFLYWHLESDAPPILGQVRFRITTSSDPATFPSGRDLQLPHGGTWKIPLFRIARWSGYSGLRAQLLSEKLVTAKVLDTVMNSSASYQNQHRIPKSDILATATIGLRKGSALPLRTLNQALVDEKDFVDLAGRVSRFMRCPMAPEEPRFQMRYVESGGRNIPFPPDSQGFFYWHLDPDAPPVSGQVRFRTATSSDLATFPTGRDLQLPDGRMWHISLFAIAHQSRYCGLRAHLLSEGLVTAKVLDTALNISAQKWKRIDRLATDSRLIWKFAQRFLVDLPSARVGLWIIGSSAGERLNLPPLFSICSRETESTMTCYVLSGSSDLGVSPQTGKDDFAKRVDYRSFTGRALVQFERSTLPEHNGTRTVVLRILKVMTKSDSDDASWMTETLEDGLHMTGIHQHIWSLDVDHPKPGSGLPSSSAKALRILFDNEALQER